MGGAASWNQLGANTNSLAPPFTGVCYSCGETGHRASECPHRVPGSQGAISINGACYNCGEWGHPAAMCPYASGPSVTGNGRVQQVSGGDVGSSDHQCPLWEHAHGPDSSPCPVPEEPEDPHLCAGGGAYAITGNWVPVKARKTGRWKDAQRFCLGGICAVPASKAPSKESVAPSCKNRFQPLAPEEKDSPWERVRMAIDSGAIDNVMPPQACASVPTKPTELSKDGHHFRDATGHAIRVDGQKDLKGLSREGAKVDMRFQVCPQVSSPLGSVRQTCEAGNNVLFRRKQDGMGGPCTTQTPEKG